VWDLWLSWGTGNIPGPALGLAANLPSNELSQQDSALEFCSSPSGTTFDAKHTQSCACARRRLQVLLGLMVTVPASCPGQRDAGEIAGRRHRLIASSLAETGFSSRREPGPKGL